MRTRTLLGAAAASALLSMLPLAAANAQETQANMAQRPMTTTLADQGPGGPTTNPEWQGMAVGDWTAPLEGRIAEDWIYGNRFDNPEHVVWNPAKRIMNEGGFLISFTQSSFDPEQYCERTKAGWDFSWVETQHRPIDMWQVSEMYNSCDVAPEAFSHGVRLPGTEERWIQSALDSGAMIIMIPTVDTKEEAEEVVHWALFPPLGARSSGGGSGLGRYGDVPGGYRNSFNDNVVIIVMLETLWAVENAEEIASVPGIDGVFAASGDLGNFSGYNQGDEAYEWMIEKINQAADNAGVRLCGPLSWHPARNTGDRQFRADQNFTCFQGGGNAANDLRERIAAGEMPAPAPAQ